MCFIKPQISLNWSEDEGDYPRNQLLKAVPVGGTQWTCREECLGGLALKQVQ